MKKRNTFTLTHDGTGQSIRAIVIARSTGGKFMKVWQDQGWEKRIGGLQGNSLRVLWHLVSVAGWVNAVPGPTEVAKQMGRQRSNVSRAYRELKEAGFLHQKDSAYFLNPLFCWKGTDDQFNQALRELSPPHLQALAKRKEVSDD